MNLAKQALLIWACFDNFCKNSFYSSIHTRGFKFLSQYIECVEVWLTMNVKIQETLCLGLKSTQKYYIYPEPMFSIIFIHVNLLFYYYN